VLRLVLSRLYDGAALLPAKLDERIRRIASVLNGGLTGANLAPAYKIPAAAFRERYSLLVLQARGGNVEGGPEVATAPLPAAGKLLWIEARASDYDSSWTPSVFVGDIGDLGAMTDLGITHWTPVPADASPYPVAAGKTERRYIFRPPAPVDVAAGDQIALGQTGGHVAVVVAIPHVA
jgi:hypothetical protein